MDFKASGIRSTISAKRSAPQMGLNKTAILKIIPILKRSYDLILEISLFSPSCRAILGKLYVYIYNVEP